MVMSPVARSIFRVKIRSLMDEARLIRFYIGKLKRMEKKALRYLDSSPIEASENGLTKLGIAQEYSHWKLREHLDDVVLFELRATLLAYGLVRGKTYEQMENTSPLSDPFKPFCGALKEKVASIAERLGQFQPPPGMTARMVVDRWINGQLS